MQPEYTSGIAGQHHTSVSERTGRIGQTPGRYSRPGVEEARRTKIEMARTTDEEIKTKQFEVLNYAGSLLERGSG